MLEALLLGSGVVEPPAPPGQVKWTSAGTYQWVVPPGVKSICCFLIAPGASGKVADVNYMGVRIRGYGGYAGGCKWKNNIAVKPGQVLTIVVGTGGTSATGNAAFTQDGFGATSIAQLGISMQGMGGGGSSGYAAENGYMYGGSAGTLAAPNATSDHGGNGTDIVTGKTVNRTGYVGQSCGGGGTGASINGTHYKYKGGDGGVRIIWGSGRAYPAARIADE